MKEGQIKRELYTSPEVEVVEIKARKILCASTSKSFGINDDEGYTEGAW